MRSRSAIATMISLAVLLLASGCAPAAPVAKPRPTPAVEVTSSPTPSPTPEPPATEIAPLRGTTVPAGSLDRPSLAAKIDNLEAARPQIGLEKADIVYEELVEGGISRYVAVWHSSIPKEIGPVRSIRPMDPDIISPLGGIVAYSGGRPNFVAMMRSTNVYNAIHGQADTDSTFYRTSAREAPHNVIVKAAALVKQHAKLAPPAQQFEYAIDAAGASAVLSGTSTPMLAERLSTIRHQSWKWDAGHGVFLRYQEGAVDRDANGKQLTAVNVVALSVKVVWPYDIVPKTVLVGSGEAWVSTGGKTLRGTWSKTSRTAPIRLADAAGMPLLLAPGNTWVELVPRSGGSVTFPK